MKYPEWLYEICDWKESENPSEPNTLVKIKPLAPCEDCDKPTDTIRVVEVRHNRTPVPHVTKRCKACGLYQNPVTHSYDYDATLIRAYWRSESIKQRKK